MEEKKLELTSGAEQIVALIDWLQINKNQFAVSIGVPQAILSHIISGRNKPSLDVIKKILLAYPQLNSNWLLFGKGDMFSSKMSPVKEEGTDTDKHSHNNSSDYNIVDSQDESNEVAHIREEIKNNKQSESPCSARRNPADKLDVRNTDKPLKTIIMIYEDNTSQIINL